MRSYRIFRPIHDEHRVMIDAEFENADRAEGFVDVMRTKVWPDPEKAPGKVGAADVRIMEMVESKEY